ncbi:MAG: hypothetical protein K2Z81_07280 [Cyanobacteria bacterium]|nr:hypothetical protein [Cyanobacteriota bacterium]
MNRILIILSLVLTVCPPVSAQGKDDSMRDIRSANANYLSSAVERGGVGTGAWQLLRQPMNLPNLPAYSGKAQFVKGLMYPNKPGGPAINLQYNVSEDPGTVISWYSDALDSYQWHSKKNQNQTLIRATRGDNGVVVRVTPSNKKGFRSELQISYKLSSPSP